MFSLSQRSIAQLDGVVDPLVKLFLDVGLDWPCEVLEGSRSPERQQLLFSQGKSRTLDSKHVPGHPGEKVTAVDVAPLPIDWRDTVRFYCFGGYVLGRARALSVRIRWGGDWNGNKDLHDQDFNDLVHFELQV